MWVWTLVSNALLCVLVERFREERRLERLEAGQRKTHSEVERRLAVLEEGQRKFEEGKRKTHSVRMCNGSSHLYQASLG